MQFSLKSCTAGLTLTELLITSVIVAVVMLGVVSLDSVVAKKRQISTAENLSSLNTRAIVNHILKNAQLAIGYGVGDHQGILIGDKVGDPITVGAGSFCINQDMRPSAMSMNWTASDNSDDRWACYTLDQRNNNIYYCHKSYNAATSYRGAGRCSSGEVVGQAVSWDPQFNVDNTQGAVKSVFTLALTTRFRPDKPKSSSNPENMVTVNVSPSGHGIR